MFSVVSINRHSFGAQVEKFYKSLWAVDSQRKLLLRKRKAGTSAGTKRAMLMAKNVQHVSKLLKAKAKAWKDGNMELHEQLAKLIHMKVMEQDRGMKSTDADPKRRR